MVRSLPKTLPFQPAQRRRLHEGVAEQLRDAILDGRIAVGDKLPPERELAAQFQINRTSVREAIKVLEALGLVAVRQGDGATVQPLIEASFDVLPAMVFHRGQVDTSVLREMGEVMLPLLLDMARLAVERVQPPQLVELRRLRDIISDTDVDREARFAASRDIVVLMADMTGNRIWQMLARRTRALLEAPPLRETRRRLRRDPGRFVPIIDHCLQALQAGRPRAAIRELRRLITLVGDSELQSSTGSSSRAAG
jgi:DNA-binding FadR family transcriptional regulator